MLEFSPEELAALKKEHAAGATDEQFTLWIEDCKRRDLVPVRDVILQTRRSMEWDPEVGARVSKNKAITITSIGALLKIAQRTGQYAGPLPAKWIYLDKDGNPTVESEVPLPDPTNPELPRQPWAAKSGVKRKDFDQPTAAVARWWAYVQTYKDKSSNEERPNSVWNTRGPEQLSKCSLAASIRLAFSEEASGLYITEEMANFDRQAAETAPHVSAEPITPAPKAAVVPKVNHTPAVATDAPRPNEQTRQSMKESLPTLVQLITQPAIEKQLADNGLAVDGRAVGDFVEAALTPPTVQKMDKPKKLTSKEKTEAILEADKNEMLAAIDNEIAKNNDPDNRLPTPEERTANSVVIRGYTAKGVNRDALKTWVLRETGNTDLALITVQKWNEVFSKLAAADTKEAVAQLIEAKPVEEEF